MTNHAIGGTWTTKLRYAARAASVLARRPGEGFDRIRNRGENLLQYGLKNRGSAPASRYTPEPPWNERLHEMLGVEWPCATAAKFPDAWSELEESLARSQLRVGLGHDADRHLASAVWCLVDHLEAATVVETGVARGITSYFALRGLERSEAGKLWSIDLPPVLPVWHREVGAAVPDSLRSRWTYLRGSSRRLLPRVFRSVDGIDLFIHDSLHTEWTVRFELELAWKHLKPGGAVVVDDVESNLGFLSFVDRVPGASRLVAKESSGGMFGIALKPRQG